MNLKLSGTIVGADYDDEIYEPWISKGIITPSSRLVSALETAAEPVEVFVNSWGGDVFAGNEIIIAARKCRMRGIEVEVEVGAKACSMAANFIAAMRASGAKVTAHANSRLMFHSCATVTQGGPQLHEDQAEMMRGVNSDVMRDLNKLGITDCRAWFSEGREKWISSEELVKMNLADSIAEDAAVDVEDPKHTASRLAAFVRVFQMEKPMNEEIKAAGASKNVPDAEKTAEVPVAEVTAAPTEAEIEAKVTALANERFANLQSKHDKEFQALKSERDQAVKDLEAAKAEATSLKAEVEKLTLSHAEELEALRAQLAAEKSAHEAIAVGALKPQPDINQMTVKSAREMMASLPAKERAAFYEAHRAAVDNH